MKMQDANFLLPGPNEENDDIFIWSYLFFDYTDFLSAK